MRYKLAFYTSVFARLSALRASGQRVLVMGDFNTPTASSTSRARARTSRSGFLPAERAVLDAWVTAGWIDTFRHFEPNGGHYTWWRQWGEARAKNVGWRIDHVFACPSAMAYVERAFIRPHVALSDHCPVGVEIRGDVMAG